MKINGTQYAVFRDCLVYLYEAGNATWAGVLRSHHPAIREHDTLIVNEEIDGTPRDATPADFEEYRVVMPTNRQAEKLMRYAHSYGASPETIGQVLRGKK